MTTVAEAMKARAIAEFDELVAVQEQRIRANLAARGCCQPEIERAVAECQPSLAEQREQIAANVVIELMKAGVPLEEDANVWNG